RRRRATARSRSPRGGAAEPLPHSDPWKTEEDPDSVPGVSRFQPRRTPGVQINNLSSHSPKDLFLLYFATDTEYKWSDIEMEDLYNFFGLLIYMSLVSLPSIQDYWKQNSILSVPIPHKVMSRDRFRTIFWNIHLSDPEEDEQNDKTKGTPGHDKLFRIRPLYDDILCACKAYFHPRRELSVDERMVGTKAKTGITQYLKDKPTKWGVKIFVLAESASGYTIAFNIYTGKTQTQSVHGLAYDVVKDLVQTSFLGTGYHIYMDNFYSSPKLFMDLARMKFGACGTYRENRKGCPRGRGNALTKKSKRGSVRWIREGPLVFVKWMDTREVSVCSTIHPAFSGETVDRRVKAADGSWSVRKIPCPTPIVAYNKNMGGVDLSDQLIQYYSTKRKTSRWYRTLLLHFLDIATTNAFILHREISSTKQEQAMTHKDFMVELMCQLCGMSKEGISQSRRADHVPVAISTVTDSAQKGSKGRLKCRHCLQYKKRHDTPWKCQACDVPLCVAVDRNCFLEWHK
uniref:Zgc:162611 n=1 Tax=Poecilia formosa TaxID=48698 RepID=A0A087X5I5_POEFO